MADAVTSQTILDGSHKLIMSFTNVSDGTGESAATKIDVSSLATSSSGAACTGVRISRIVATTSGMSVQILWDATANVLAWNIPDGAEGVVFEGCEYGGLKNNAGAGVTGDVLFTTVGHTSGDVYSIVLEMTKVYG